MNLKRPVRTSILAKTAVFMAFFSLVPLFLLTSAFTMMHHEFFWPGVLLFVGLTCVFLGVAYGFARHLTRPVHALMQGAERIAKRDFSTFVQIDTHDELQDLANAFNSMCEDLKQFSNVHVDEVMGEQAKTEGVIAASEDGIILTDDDGHVQLINPKALSMLELEEGKEGLSGRPIWSFVKHDKLAIAIRDSIEGDSPKSKLEVNLSTDSTRRYYLITSSIINAPEGSGTTYWFMVQVRNVTAEKELDQLKDDFLQSLTHDLRSPMTAVRGYLQVLGEEMAGPLNDEQKKMIHIMENASTKLLHIVSNLLDSAKMSAGKLKLSISDCNLRQVLPNTVEIFHTEAAKKKITLTLDMPEQVRQIKLDTHLLERVIINLIGNAIKFTPEGGFITIKVVDLSDRVQIQVTDTGNGMPAEFLNKIFKKFEQASGTRGGTGLGLSICKFVVDEHYGEIGVRSKQGEGTTFTFSIPRGLEQNERGEVFRVRTSTSAAA